MKTEMIIMDERIKKMLNSFNENHFAQSRVTNDDSEFFKAIGEEATNKLATTSFYGSDVVYYNTERVEPGVGSMRPKKK